MSAKKRVLTFPQNFRFGIGDADLQVVGEKHTLKEEKAERTMWAHLAAKGGYVEQNHTPDDGIDRYHRYPEDVEILKSLNIKHYRTSVSMARTLTSKGEVNMAAIKWYRNYFTALKNAGILVYVTLYHWEMPLHLHERGGWASPDSVDWYVKHVNAVYEHLNDLIEEYFLINEHVCVAFLGYHLGLHAPFERDFRKALLAGHHLLLAQGRGFRELKKRNPALNVSTVCNPAPLYAASTSENDLLARRLAYCYCTEWFIEPLYTGKYPAEALKHWEADLPKINPNDMETIKIGPELTNLGINYYMGMTVEYDPTVPNKYKIITNPEAPTTSLGWPIYKEPYYRRGLYDLLTDLYAKYASMGLKSITLTENGTACNSPKTPNGCVDDARIDYVTEHLHQLHDAIIAGVPVNGYFLWTLMDNYEWQYGYTAPSCFGIVHVDRETMERTPKKSFEWYKGIVNGRVLPF